MRGSLLEWLEDPDAGRGLHFAGDDGWSSEPYPRLARLVAGTGAELIDLRLPAESRVCIVLPSGLEFVSAFLGTLYAGGTPCPIVPPNILQDPDEYVTHAADIMRAARPALVVADRDLRPLVNRAAERAGLAQRVQILSFESEGAPPGPRPPAELALLQFTSGSTGPPRGVRVPRESLEGNLEMIWRWLGMTRADGTVSWLPLYHDLGLIGCLLTPIAHQSSLWVMRPEQFVRDPARWLEPLGRGQAVITAAPSFGYGFAARRIPPERLEGLDFSAWRGAVAAADRLDPAAMARFTSRLEPHGFDRRAILPAYGLAEATLAVSALYPGAVTRALRLDWSSIAFGEEVAVEDEALVCDPEIGDGSGWLLSCGVPHPGVSVSIVDDDGRPLPDGHLGEVAVRGEYLAAGYDGDPGDRAGTFLDGELRTGDAGFLHRGDLFVVGRMGDSLKVRGRTVYMEAVEARLATATGLSPGRCVVFGGADEDAGTLVALVEEEPGPWVEPAAQALESAAGADAGIKILAGPRGSIERTSSGKPRRRPMWQRLLEQRLEAEVVWEGGALAVSRR